jgi:outer membrane protein OmpA-like peptidoglycan-associated protein
LLSDNLKTHYNDGPATFNSKGDTICYSRNLEVEGKFDEISYTRNKLGLFYAVFDGKEWTKIMPLRINNAYYNVTSPTLSPDGKMLFFASDKPGGFGGSDLYYSEWKGGIWNDPVNLGPQINTGGNESYPFVNYSGEILFSSDGHPGLGGKDIFFSRFYDSEWLTPIHIDAPINSQYDDFGIVTDTLMNEGYFSSNRDKSVDIFHFRTIHSQIFYNIIQKENQYCFIFNDKGSIAVDTTNLQFRWSFGDKESARGEVVGHCFPGPGNYNIRLDIIERGTGKLFFTKLMYKLDLRDFEQPYINSVNVAVKGNSVLFDGLRSNLPGYRILSYSWDFGDGERSNGENALHSFKEKGEYVVNLELIIKSDSSGNIHKTGISKKIEVLNDMQDRVSYMYKIASKKSELSDVVNYRNSLIYNLYSAEAEFRKEAVFNIELLSSRTKIGLDSWTFRNVPKWYPIKEIFNQEDSLYTYVADQQLSLMATYPVYKELTGLGFKNTKIKLFVLKDPAAKELITIKKLFGVSTDVLFKQNDLSLSSAGTQLLDLIMGFMDKYPRIKLEVATFTDNSGTSTTNQSLSQKRAELMVNYLVINGVNASRLISKGYGEHRPITLNSNEAQRRLNRRVDFTIVR